MPPKKREPAKPAAKAAPRAPRSSAKPGGDLLAPAAAPAPPINRPVSLDEVAGHVGPRRALRTAVASGRVHHAWVFAGEPGVGKFTAALAFAAELLLPPPGHPQHAPLADLLRHGAHPDLHVITKELASHSREDNVRRQKQTNIAKAVLEQFLLEPLVRTRAVTVPSPVGKVFIVDEAELIDPTGQNTMLKTLEEPPEGTAVILVTAVEPRLLPTIRSRCQRIAFSPLAPAELVQVLHAKGADLPAEQRDWTIWYAKGSPGAALSAIEHGLFAWHAELSPMLDLIAAGRPAPALGSALAKQVEARVEAAVKSRPEASKDAANRLWTKRLLGFLAERARALIPRGGEQALAAIRTIDLCRESERQLDANVAYATVLDHLASQMMTPEPVF